MSRLSIVIPVLNEKEHLPKLLHSIQKTNLSANLVVVDAGSTDGSTAFLESAGVKWVASEAGRSVQMNAGAALCNSEYLLFLHADVMLPENAHELLNNLMDKKVRLANFKFRFDDPHFLLKVIQFFTRFKANPFLFGDQGLFIEADLFRQLGGFNENMLLLEDQDLMRRAKAHSSFEKIQAELLVSARQYQKTGILKLQAIYTYIYIRYRCGARQEKLLKLYQRYLNQ